MKKFFLPLLLLAFVSCSDDPASGKNDSAKETASLAPPLPRRDSLAIDVSASSLKWNRAKTVKDVEQTVKIGKASMKMKLDQASFSVSGDIPVQSGAWYLLDKKADGGYVRFDMTQLQGLQINKDERLEMMSPDYLDVEKYPTALLRIKSLKEDHSVKETSEPRDPLYDVEAELTIKDTTAVIHFPGYVRMGANGLPEKLEGKFTIDGIKWKLNRKTAKVVKDEMEFTVMFVTKK